MRFSCLAFSLSLAVLASASPACAAKPSSEDGLWTGSIGTSSVIACFQHEDASIQPNPSGYFYLRHAQLIHLLPVAGKNGSWLEGDKGKPTGSWDIHAQGGRITGQWSDPARTRALPIRLDRFDSLSNDETSIDCDPESGLFNPVVYPKVFAQKIASGPIKTIGGKRYRVLSALGGDVASVELLDDPDRVRILNALLAAELKEAMASYFECASTAEPPGAKSGGVEKHDYDGTIEPMFWNAQWISFVETTSGDCGGAHPFSGSTDITWNLAKGEKVDPWTWIKDNRKRGAAPNDDSYAIDNSAPQRLNAIITKRALLQRKAQAGSKADDDDCTDAIKGNDEYNIRLDTKGLVFTQDFPHVEQACDDDIIVGYAELAPFLTKEGTEAVKSLRKSGP